MFTRGDIFWPTSLLADFESNSWGDWQVVDSSEEEKQFLADEGDVEATYRPWYSERFKSLNEVIGYWDANQAMLEKNSRLFSDAFYSSSLPAEVLEAVATNLTYGITSMGWKILGLGRMSGFFWLLSRKLYACVELCTGFAPFVPVFGKNLA